MIVKIKEVEDKKWDEGNPCQIYIKYLGEPPVCH